VSTVLIILCIIISSLGIFWNFRSYKRYKLNLTISEELTRIVDETADILRANKKITEKKKVLSVREPLLEGRPDVLLDSAMLGTIVTVLVNKFGDTRLNMDDFMIPDETFVSVYVDTSTQEIILSLDPHLQKDDLSGAMMGFGNASDDNTFH